MKLRTKVSGWNVDHGFLFTETVLNTQQAMVSLKSIISYHYELATAQEVNGDNDLYIETQVEKDGEWLKVYGCWATELIGDMVE